MKNNIMIFINKAVESLFHGIAAIAEWSISCVNLPDAKSRSFLCSFVTR